MSRERDNGMFRVALEELKHCYNHLYDNDLSDDEREERDELLKLCARIANVETAINTHFGDRADDAKKIQGQLNDEMLGEFREFSWEDGTEEDVIKELISYIEEDMPATSPADR